VRSQKGRKGNKDKKRDEEREAVLQQLVVEICV